MKLQRIFLPLASYWKSFFPNDFSISYFYHIISSLHTVAGNGVVNKLAADSLMKKEKLKKVGSFWCNLLKAISTDLLQIKKDCKKHCGKWWTRGQQTSVSSSLIPPIAILSRWSITHIHHREPLLNFSSLSHLFLFLWFFEVRF